MWIYFEYETISLSLFVWRIASVAGVQVKVSLSHFVIMDKDWLPRLLGYSTLKLRFTFSCAVFGQDTEWFTSDICLHIVATIFHQLQPRAVAKAANFWTNLWMCNSLFWSQWLASLSFFSFSQKGMEVALSVLVLQLLMVTVLSVRSQQSQVESRDMVPCCWFRLWILCFQGPSGDYWDSWGPYGECSRSCGSGITMRSRRCITQRFVSQPIRGLRLVAYFSGDWSWRSA